MKAFNDKLIEPYRTNTIGNDLIIPTKNGFKKMIYADWAASGRLYRPIEDEICNKIGPLYGNTHSVDSYIGAYINSMYEDARKNILNECRANDGYELLIGGSGGTFALHRFQEIMSIDKKENVFVFISSQEHHTNYLTWLSLGAEVVIVEADTSGTINLIALEEELKKLTMNSFIIGSFIATSNVTGITTNYIEAIKKIKQYNGIGVVDYSATAPHTSLDFSDQIVDAGYWGIHKFLGGPSGPGILVFKSELYERKMPTIPAGGTVLWTDPEKRTVYFEDISKREDPGTPSILQTIRASMSHQLLTEIGIETLAKREMCFTDYLINSFSAHPHITLFGSTDVHRYPIISLNINGLSYTVVTKILSDYYGIQVRGGCSCTSLYAHQLLQIDKKASNKLWNQIQNGIYENKPGWVRISLHGTMSGLEVKRIANAVNEISNNIKYFNNEYE